MCAFVLFVKNSKIEKVSKSALEILISASIVFICKISSIIVHLPTIMIHLKLKGTLTNPSPSLRVLASRDGPRDGRECGQVREPFRRRDTAQVREPSRRDAQARERAPSRRGGPAHGPSSRGGGAPYARGTERE